MTPSQYIQLVLDRSRFATHRVGYPRYVCMAAISAPLVIYPNRRDIL